MQAYLDKLLSAGRRPRSSRSTSPSCSDCACAYRFEVKLRQHVKACCGGQADEDHCREELLAKLKSCCGGAADERPSES